MKITAEKVEIAFPWWVIALIVIGGIVIIKITPDEILSFARLAVQKFIKQLKNLKLLLAVNLT